MNLFSRNEEANSFIGIDFNFPLIRHIIQDRGLSLEDNHKVFGPFRIGRYYRQREMKF